jgi:hypothetical protein
MVLVAPGHAPHLHGLQRTSRSLQRIRIAPLLREHHHEHAIRKREVTAGFIQLERATQIAVLLGSSAELQAERRSALRGVVLVRIVRLARINRRSTPMSPTTSGSTRTPCGESLRLG